MPRCRAERRSAFRQHRRPPPLNRRNALRGWARIVPHRRRAWFETRPGFAGTLLTMTYIYDSVQKDRHPEEAAKRTSRRTRGINPGRTTILAQPLRFSALPIAENRGGRRSALRPVGWHGACCIAAIMTPP